MNWNSPIHLLSLRQNNLIPKIMRKFKKIDDDTWMETTEDDNYSYSILIVLIIAGVIWVGKWIYDKILIAIAWCSQTIDAIGNWFSGIF